MISYVNDYIFFNSFCNFTLSCAILIIKYIYIYYRWNKRITFFVICLDTLILFSYLNNNSW